MSDSQPSTHGHQLPKGYRQSEVGAIPEDWGDPMVGSVCGCIVPGRNKPKLFDGDIPWITTPDLEDGRSVTTSRLGLFISRFEAKAVGSKVVPPNAVLMSCAGELGIVALTKNEIVVNQQLHVFLPTERIDPTFLLNALFHRRTQIAGLGTKTAVPYLNKTSCNSIKVPLPPLPEQRVIAEALSDVDGLLGALDRLIAKKRDLKQAAMQQLLTGQTRLPGFHGEWEVRELGNLIDCSPSGTYGVERPSPTLLPMPVATTAQISSDDRWNGKAMQTRYFTAEQVATYGVALGDLVVVKSSGSAASIQSGKMVLIDQSLAGSFLFSNFLMRLRPKAVSAQFLYFFLTSSRIKAMLPSLCEASTYPNIRINEYLEIEVPTPEIPEQTAIAEVLSDMDTELTALEQRREKTRALKQGMMQELLTGRTRLV